MIVDESYDSHQSAALRYGADCAEGLLVGTIYSLSIMDDEKIPLQGGFVTLQFPWGAHPSRPMASIRLVWTGETFLFWRRERRHM